MGSAARRHTHLDPQQRHAWIIAGLKASENGAFPGVTVVPLLNALAEENPVPLESAPPKLAARVIRENDLQTSGGKDSLTALRGLVATWHDGGAHTRNRRIFAHTRARSSRGLCPARLLRRPRPSGLAHHPRRSRQAARGLGTLARAHARLTPAVPAELKPYTGLATVFPAPQPITDPSDKRWRAELEINKVTVSDFDLAWCIDSTGSMAPRNQRVAEETRLLVYICAWSAAGRAAAPSTFAMKPRPI